MLKCKRKYRPHNGRIFSTFGMRLRSSSDNQTALRIRRIYKYNRPREKVKQIYKPYIWI